LHIVALRLLDSILTTFFSAIWVDLADAFEAAELQYSSLIGDREVTAGTRTGSEAGAKMRQSAGLANSRLFAVSKTGDHGLPSVHKGRRPLINPSGSNI